MELSGELAGVQPSAAVLYTGGARRWQGWAQVRLPRLRLLRMPWELSLELLARTEPMGWDRAYPELLNSVAAAVLHRDYYDWVYRAGWRAALEVRPLRRLSLLLGVERSWQDSLPVRASRSLFRRASWRENPRQRLGTIGSGGCNLPPAALHSGDGCLGNLCNWAPSWTCLLEGHRMGSSGAYSALSSRRCFRPFRPEATNRCGWSCGRSWETPSGRRCLCSMPSGCVRCTREWAQRDICSALPLGSTAEGVRLRSQPHTISATYGGVSWGFRHSEDVAWSCCWAESCLL
jgi:hypothetical protein